MKFSVFALIFILPIVSGRNNRGGQAASAAAAAKAAQASQSAAAASAAAASNSAAAAAAASSAALTATASSAAGTTSAAAAQASSTDPQSSLTLDPGVIATGFENNGQDVPTAGQIASLTSSNNFINFCLLSPNLPITNGKQITTGSCNPAPIGVIPSTANMPSAKFASPQNFGTVPANTAFTIALNAANIELGNFVNAKENYFAAPQTLNAQGQIIGHTHIVVEQLPSITTTTPTNPNDFAFFKGVDNAAVNGQVSVDVSAGVPPGAYRVCTINSSSNHQPVIVPIAQHGSLDDCIYFTATAGGAAAANNSTAAAGGAAAGGAAAATNTAAAAATNTAAAAAGNAAQATAATQASATAATAAAGANSAAAAKASATSTGRKGRKGFFGRSFSSEN